MGRSMQELMIFNSFLENTSDSIVIKEYFATEQGEFTGGKIICASAVKARHYGQHLIIQLETVIYLYMLASIGRYLHLQIDAF